jgi:glutamate carboxypeptidase
VVPTINSTSEPKFDLPGATLPLAADAGIINFLQHKVPEFLVKLREVVEINSHTLNPSGVRLVGEKHARHFEPLNFTPEWIQDTSQGFGDHLILSKKGNSAITIGLVGHLDTVYTAAEEQKNNFSWREDGPRIYGPGTVDMKGGNLMIWLALATLQNLFPAEFDAVNWVVLYNSREEIRGTKFRDICHDKLAGAAAAFVFEGTYSRENQFKLLTYRKGRAVFRIKVEGKSSHAGPLQKGANAIVQLAHTVGKIHALTDFEKGLTYNVGQIQGGTAINRVPHEAEAMVELRAWNSSDYELGKTAVLALQNDIVVFSRLNNHPCKVQIEIESETQPWSETPANRALFEIWNKVAQSFGWTLISQSQGGLGDANEIGRFVPTLDGLGVDGGHAHCSEHTPDGSKQQEFFYPDSIVPRTAMNVLGLRDFIRQSIQ